MLPVGMGYLDGQSDTVVVLRHALAGAKLSDHDLDRERGLDGHGLATAGVLPAALLEHVVPATIVSSPYRRCLQTVEPLAAETGLGTETSDALLPDAAVADARRLLSHLPTGSIVCTHGELIKGLFGVELEKGAFLLVHQEDGLLSPVRYFGPPEPARPPLSAR